jgi:acid phosphatase type 7
MSLPARRWIQGGRDLCREALIAWHGLDGVASAVSEIEYRVRGGGGAWTTASGYSRLHPFSGVESPESWPRPARLIHHVPLSGLVPGTEYEIRWAPGGETRWFRTFPLSPNGMRVAICGDIGGSSDAVHMVAMQGATADLMLVNGDHAYSDSSHTPSAYTAEQTYWNLITAGLERPDGRMIPMLPTIGNHEVAGGSADWTDRYTHAQYYYRAFDVPANHEGAYDAWRAGDWLLLIGLDMHTSRPSAPRVQTPWLSALLASTSEVAWRLPCMHIPAYPAVRAMSSLAQSIVNIWEPLFHGAGIRDVFGAHEHLYMRTIPTLAAAPNADGVTYHGCGSAGRTVREAAQAASWWVDEIHGDEDINRGMHYHLVRWDATRMHIDSVGRDGVVFHTLARGAAPPGPPRRVRVGDEWQDAERRVRVGGQWVAT